MNLNKEYSAKVIQVKIAKGGMGKSFITAQLSSLLAALGYKTLNLTTDPQNDLYGMLINDEITEKSCGLKEAVLRNENYDLLKLRENLYYIPLDFEGYFSPEFFKRLPNFLNELRKKFDFILIDSSPAPRTDKAFLELADYVIVPLAGNVRAVKGVTSVFENIDANKIIAIVFNLFRNTRLENDIYNELKNYCETNELKHLMTEPIPYLALIEELVAKRKTIWESKSKKLESTQRIFQNLALKIIELKEGN